MGCMRFVASSASKISHLSTLCCIEKNLSCSVVVNRKCEIQSQNKFCNIQKLNQSKFYSTEADLPNLKNNNFFNKIWKKPFNRSKFKLQGYLHYENIVDVIDYSKWFKTCNFSDDFMSWFLVTELHIWMLMVRCMAEGEDGRNLRNDIVEAFWNDVSLRSKKIGPISAAKVNEDIQLLSEQFQAAIAGYDEGLLSNDMVLAGAIWRRFYQMSGDDATAIERIIVYIRKQTIMLDKIPKEKFFDDKIRSVYWTAIPSIK